MNDPKGLNAEMDLMESGMEEQVNGTTLCRLLEKLMFKRTTKEMCLNLELEVIIPSSGVKMIEQNNNKYIINIGI